MCTPATFSVAFWGEKAVVLNAVKADTVVPSTAAGGWQPQVERQRARNTGTNRPVTNRRGCRRLNGVLGTYFDSSTVTELVCPDPLVVESTAFTAPRSFTYQLFVCIFTFWPLTVPEPVEVMSSAW